MSGKQGEYRWPFVPRPLPEESLVSWVDQIAKHSGLSRADVVYELGLVSRVDPLRRSMTQFVMFPRPTPKLTARTGVTRAEVDAMSTRRYRNADLARTQFYEANWVLTKRSNACIACLRENGCRWLLPWRMTLVALCLRHRCYLLTKCVCGRPLHSSDLYRGPAWFRCSGRRGGAREPCGKLVVDLDGEAAVEDSALLTAQQRIMELLDGEVSHEAKRLVVELMWAVMLVAYYGSADLVDGADAAVVEAFAGFCRDRDAGLPGRPKPVGIARESCLTMAALIKAASELVFADDLAAQVTRFCEITQPAWGAMCPFSLRRGEFAEAERLVAAFADHGLRCT